MFVGHLKVVTRGDRLGVAQPLADYVDGELFGELSLAGAPQVVEQLGPGIDTSAANDPQQLCSQIGVRVPVAGN
nr:hypothetical protein [Aeoliella straminimaris]